MSDADLIQTFKLNDVAATCNLAERLAPVLGEGDIIALEGDLGAGKTEFCRALIHALGYAEDVPSPTFTLVQVYDSQPLAVWHVDLYRLDVPEEIVELGLEEAFEDALTLIEWPERMGDGLPQECLHLHLEITGESRTLTLTGGQDWRTRLKDL